MQELLLTCENPKNCPRLLLTQIREYFLQEPSISQSINLPPCSFPLSTVLYPSPISALPPAIMNASLQGSDLCATSAICQNEQASIVLTHNPPPFLIVHICSMDTNQKWKAAVNTPSTSGEAQEHLHLHLRIWDLTSGTDG
jgi:hypothetical protein